MSVMGLDDLNINRVAQRPRGGFGETESQIDARGKIGRLTNGDLRSGRRQRLGLSVREARCTDDHRHTMTRADCRLRQRRFRHGEVNQSINFFSDCLEIGRDYHAGRITPEQLPHVSAQ